jgi:hypothetical protein
MKQILLIIAIFSLTACSPEVQNFKSNVPVVNTIDGELVGSIETKKVEPTDDPIVAPIGATSGATMEPQSVIPSQINLDVPFFPQAPDGNWGLPWQEACEEAASTLAYYYASGKPLTKAKFKQEIENLVAWEIKNFGDYKDTDIAQTAEMIREYFGYKNLEIIENPTVEQMKKFLSEKKAIVAPFAGRELKNPYYTGKGPIYHMMVIKGYDDKNFIVNDNGTRRGHNYIYTYETIMSAMHEWNAKDMDLGAKKVIVLY